MIVFGALARYLDSLIGGIAFCQAKIHTFSTTRNNTFDLFQPIDRKKNSINWIKWF